ncbi:MAG: NAD(P)-dependent oxidoreductase [Chloroflexota bacterium]
MITGANGFIGRHCLPFLLASGAEVHAVTSRLPAESESAGIHWHQADLLNEAETQVLIAKIKPSHLLLLAWYVEPGQFWTSPENLRWVQASLSLLQAFAQHGGERVIMAGTCAEYDWRYGYCSEAVTPLLPKTLYATSKHALHLILDSFAQQANLSAAWGRVFFLYGPYEHPNRLVSSVIRSLLRGESARCSHGNQQRDFLHVEDVASAFVALFNSEVRGAVNIASGKPVTLQTIIHKIATTLHQENLVQFGAIPVPADDPPLLVGDVRRLTSEVGWSPRYDLDQGLADTIHWWQDQLANTAQEKQ